MHSRGEERAHSGMVKERFLSTRHFAVSREFHLYIAIFGLVGINLWHWISVLTVWQNLSYYATSGLLRVLLQFHEYLIHCALLSLALIAAQQYYKIFSPLPARNVSLRGVRRLRVVPSRQFSSRIWPGLLPAMPRQEDDCRRGNNTAETLHRFHCFRFHFRHLLPGLFYECHNKKVRAVHPPGIPTQERGLQVYSLPRWDGTPVPEFHNRRAVPR